jgi:hypothetical protein
MRMHKLIEAVVAAGCLALWCGAAYADAGAGSSEEFSARLSGFQELGTLNNQTGAILSDGTATLKLDLDTRAKSIAYTLTYSNVGTTAPLTGTVTQAHIHFGKGRDSGGILVFFCTNSTFAGTGPAPQTCPKNTGKVTGTFSAANVQAIPSQNVTAGDFDALVAALASNTAYANIHTTALGAGEIRGQIHADDNDHQKNHN